MFEFSWFDYKNASEVETAQILHVYQHTFEHDIGLQFDAKLDSDFTAPLTYYGADVRGAFGVIWEVPSVSSSSSSSSSRRIVGTVGVRRISIPDACWNNNSVGAEHLPTRDDPRREEVVCELKRMFILPCARGKGLSKVMLNESIALAQSLGYTAMVLDTKKKLAAANHVYEAGGFQEFSDYNDNPRADRFMIRRL